MRRDVSVSRLNVQACRQARFFVHGWAVSVLLWTAGCSVDNVGIPVDGRAPVPVNEAGLPAPADVPILVVPDSGMTDGGVACNACSCGTGNTQRCGDVLDNCGQIQHCPACAGGAACVNNVCIGACVGCSVPGGDFCGEIGDGCGGTLECPTTCPKAGWLCQDNIC